jgi:signal transduction histidine kinase
MAAVCRRRGRTEAGVKRGFPGLGAANASSYASTVQSETPPGTLEELRAEVIELRASRERLVLAADADRQRLERELHEGVQQHLVALAVNIQLAESLLESDVPAAAKLLHELRRDVQEGLTDAAHLAQRIHAPLLEQVGFAAALRSAAVSAGIPASVEVSADSNYQPEIVQTVYSFWLEALDHRSTKAPAALTVREEVGALTFEIVLEAARSDDWLDRLRDRVEALGGSLQAESQRGHGVHVCGSLPLSR